MSSQFPFHGIFSSLGQEPLEEPAMDDTAPFSEAPAQMPAFRATATQPTMKAQSSSGQGTKGQIAVDIFEQDNYYIIRAPIAGVRLSDLDIEITDNIITIRGNRQQTEAVPNNQYYLQECFWGEFSRSVTLPFTIDPKKIKATFNKECILKILIPKEEKVKIVRISEA